ncbi:MAG: T9SS type A sorting domain-containing protein [Bacteroidetes bacterium]|nr:T9SS type A sorting domain-containing protein [Bacteroidota bacterium]MBS1685174.1 T9SS type A sorting domain-containing protein [Bacteroidota bacterium]
MKKLALLSLVSVMGLSLVAGNDLSRKLKPTPRMTAPGAQRAALVNNANAPQRSARSGSLQKVMVGSAGNLLTVLNSASRDIVCDSTINTVLFIHRNDQTAACCNTGNNNVGQYRYDYSKDGGTTWNLNLGVLNPSNNNGSPGINGRYPQAMLERQPWQTNADSTWFIYDGTWHNGESIAVWEGNYYGSAQLGGGSATYSEARDTVNHGEIEILESLTRGEPHTYWNITRAYIQTSSTTDSIYGLVVEKGVYDTTTHATTWTNRVLPVAAAHFYDANGNAVGHALLNPTIAFDPTGQIGWILFTADMVEDQDYILLPQVMKTTDGGATWGPVETLHLDEMPGMFNNTVTTDGTKKSIMGDAQITVDSAGNPHVIAIVDQADSTSNQYSFYPLAVNVLYDIYRNPSIPGCNWQANMLAQVFSYNADYVTSSSGALSDGNRVQVARSDDGTKIFALWTDTDTSVVAGVTDAGNTNISPNLFGVGIDMTIRKVTDIKNFTAGDSMFGGTTVNMPAGAVGGALFPSVSYNPLHKTNGDWNVPAVLTNPDYRAAVGTKSSDNPAQFYYCQNLNFSPSDFVYKFDNAPPTLIVNGPDTVFVQKGHPYNRPTSSAADCQYGVITPSYTDNIPVDGSNNTDSIGVYHATWTATNPENNSSTFTQTVIVADVPIAHITYIKYTGQTFHFQDSSENLPTNHIWTWGDGTSNPFNVTSVNKTYSSNGQKTVVLSVSNVFGQDTAHAIINVTIGINDPEFEKTISVYPNPSTGVVNIEMPSTSNDEAMATVFNALGEIATESTPIKGSKTTLNLSNLAPGAYILKIQTASGKNALKQISIAR